MGVRRNFFRGENFLGEKFDIHGMGTNKVAEKIELLKVSIF